MTDTNQEVRETPELLPCPFCGSAVELRPSQKQRLHQFVCLKSTSTCAGSGLYQCCLAENEASAIEAWNTRAVLASAPSPAVPDAVGVHTVRLDWRDLTFGMTPHWQASHGFGDYNIRQDAGEPGYEFVLRPAGQGFPNLEEAKAAAQADFDRRILSSIEPTPSPEPQADKLRSALERIKFRLHFMGWPAESMWNAGSAENPLWRADWRYEIDLLENALHGTAIANPEKPTDTIRRNQVPVSPEPQASNAGAVEALRELLEACEADCGVPGDGDEDDEAVGASEEGPMALTFGMLRRARAALRTKPEAHTLVGKEGDQ